MASGSGKDQGDIQTQEPIDGQREESESSANAAAAAAAELPPPSPPPERLQESLHGPPEAGAQNPSSSATATAAADALAPSCQGSLRSGLQGPLPSPSCLRLRPQQASLPPRPMAGADAVRTKWKRMNRAKDKYIDIKEVFGELMLECETIREMDQKAEAEKLARQQEEQVTSPTILPEEISKKPLWRKFFDRIGNSGRNYSTMIPHVNYEKISMIEIIRHYKLLELVAGRGVEFDSNALNLPRDYSEFRPVHGDEECFYRSFIFSYLEQVLDRQDTHEEHRLLVAVKEVARLHKLLGWASEFSRSHKAFKKLIKKVMRWKTYRRWKLVPTTNSYRKEKLLDFFSSYVRTQDIFAFLRLIAATWICSHRELFEPLIPELNEGYTLTDWCFYGVIERKVFANYVQIIALVTALGVPLRMEYLFQEAGQDLYTGQDSREDMPRSTCWPRHPHLLPPDHEVPRVTLLYVEGHYDIIYPHRSDGPATSDKVESPTSKSPSQHRGGSCSGENSGQQAGQRGS
ncbi:hypothetical protein BS78_K092900 [Paspalum vaginatum]|uniref:OTU domain-containing protein n=1 Tax=Paspalum vaginatum TaxID=158149 RepID=A0A9W8CE14_9POAL|nr:hypothetical protein BS78_K092900 [Paspalum vaginatum]